MKKIIVLGGGVDQIALIKDLKERGFYTILVDYYQNPIAKSFADKHIQESTLDINKVLEIAIKEKVVNIITACTDQALLTVAYVAEKLNFSTQFSFEQARNITNKIYMKKIMYKAGIPTSKFVSIKSLSEGIGDLQYPLMVKPADCNGSFGVRKVHNSEELEFSFNNAIDVSRSHTAIIEEFKEGVEVSVDAFIKDGQTTILMCSQINKKQINKAVSIIYQTLIPAPISQGAMDKIQWIVEQIGTAFSLNNTPILVQTIVSGDEVNVIEFSARIGGGLKHQTIKEKTGFDILHANVSCVLGEPFDIDRNEDMRFYSRTHLYTYPAIFGEINGYYPLIENGIIESISPTKTRGMQIMGATASRDRVGSFLIKAKTREDLKYKIEKTLKTIQVLDIEGNDILNKPIYQE